MNSLNEIEIELAVLKSEVASNFEGLVQALEAGAQTIIVSYRALGKDLNAELFQMIGRMVVLCNQYGSTIIFLNKAKSVEVINNPSFQD